MKKDDKIVIKSEAEIKKMAEGGKKLGRIKARLKEKTKEGEKASEIEKLACELIKKEGGKPSFKMVGGYHWATCVNVNEGVVHGIPKKEVVFKKGDVVSVDVGMFYQGFHTDTSFSVGIGDQKDINNFLLIGKKAIKKAISKAKVGNRIFDISGVIEKVVKSGRCEPIQSLVGHGVGKSLHESPQIPCFVSGERKNSPIVCEGMTLAIEVMYAKGKPDLKLDNDGWTINTRDGTISALFEETVAVTKKGPVVLTKEVQS